MATTGHVYRDTWYSGQRCHCCNLTDADHAARQADLMAEARGWVADCEWADDFKVDELTAEQIKRGIERHYDGGWRAFVADSRPFVSAGA